RVGGSAEWWPLCRVRCGHPAHRAPALGAPLWFPTDRRRPGGGSSGRALSQTAAAIGGRLGDQLLLPRVLERDRSVARVLSDHRGDARGERGPQLSAHLREVWLSADGRRG